MPLSKGGDKMNTWTCTRQGELYHHGIKGQKWGVRRFQNKDGSLTPAGEKRYDNPSDQVNSNSKNKSIHKIKLEDSYIIIVPAKCGILIPVSLFSKAPARPPPL